MVLESPIEDATINVEPTQSEREKMAGFQKLLNDHAEELGLERNVVPVMPPAGEFSSVIWIYENGDDIAVDLGWNAEQAFDRLSQISVN